MKSGLALLLAALAIGAAGAARADPVEDGRKKADEVCAACHGKDGNTPIDPSYPRLAGQYRDYLVQALIDYQRDRRRNPIMSAQAKPLTRQEIHDLAAYYASLEGTLEHRP